MSDCTCGENNHNCYGVYRHCPTAVTAGDFKWAGDYDQDAKVDDITVNVGLNDILSIQQPGDNDEDDLILIFGREDIRKFREILQQAEQILDDREKLKQTKGEHNG